MFQQTNSRNVGSNDKNLQKAISDYLVDMANLNSEDIPKFKIENIIYEAECVDIKEKQAQQDIPIPKNK
jgi:hypothetical protein